MYFLFYLFATQIGLEICLDRALRPHIGRIKRGTQNKYGLKNRNLILNARTDG